MAFQSKVGSPDVSFIGKLANDKSSYSRGALATVKIPVGVGVFGTRADQMTNVKPSSNGFFLGIVINSGTIQSNKMLGDDIYVEQGEQGEYASRGQIFTAISAASGSNAPNFGDYIYADDAHGLLLYGNTPTAPSGTNATPTPFRVVQVDSQVAWSATQETCYMALLSTNFF